MIFLTGGPLFACAPEVVPIEKPVTAGTLIEEPQAVKKESWQVGWDKTLKEARQEGKVILYSTYPSEARTAIRQALKGKYGIDAEFITGRGGELRARIDTERRSGLYTGDFFLKGIAGEDFALIKAGTVDPLKPLLILPEVLDTKAWWGGKLAWVDDAGQYFLGFMAFPSGQIYMNTDLVNPDEIKSYRDLLNPKWKGKIMLSDPTVSGSANMWFSVMVNHIAGTSYMRELANQEPIILRDMRLLSHWLAVGKYPVLIGVSPRDVAEFVHAGAPIKSRTLQEGGWVAQGSGAISYINRAPHPAAARVFVNWLLTREGGTIVSREIQSHSARVDVPTEHLSAEEIRLEGVKYFDARTESVQLEQLKSLEISKEIFGPLLK